MGAFFDGQLGCLRQSGPRGDGVAVRNGCLEEATRSLSVLSSLSSDRRHQDDDRGRLGSTRHSRSGRGLGHSCQFRGSSLGRWGWRRKELRYQDATNWRGQNLPMVCPKAGTNSPSGRSRQIRTPDPRFVVWSRRQFPLDVPIFDQGNSCDCPQSFTHVYDAGSRCEASMSSGCRPAPLHPRGGYRSVPASTRALS